MKLFLDTSSLIKLYYQEDGTAKLDQIFDNYPVEKIFLSEISITEFFSAIYKKFRTKDITLRNAEDILNSFTKDKDKFTFTSVNSAVINTSQILLEKYGPKGLRALDAIQFASIYNIRDTIDIAVTEDKLLNSFWVSEGVRVS